MIKVRVKKVKERELRAAISSLADGPLRTTMRRARSAVLEHVAGVYLDTVLQDIDDGRAKGPKLSASWAKAKGHSAPWWDSKALRDAIQIRKIHHRLHVGVAPESKNERGEPLDLISLCLEIGSMTIPARPLFEPAAQKLNRRSAKSLGLPGIIKQAMVRGA